MKKIFNFTNNTLLITAISLSCIGCNINPSKEARIQALETQMINAMDKIDSLEKRIKTLEGVNEELKISIHELEDR
jgi:hypothetical protein